MYSLRGLDAVFTIAIIGFICIILGIGGIIYSVYSYFYGYTTVTTDHKLVPTLHIVKDDNVSDTTYIYKVRKKDVNYYSY